MPKEISLEAQRPEPRFLKVVRQSRNDKSDIGTETAMSKELNETRELHALAPAGGQIAAGLEAVGVCVVSQLRAADDAGHNGILRHSAGIARS